MSHSSISSPHKLQKLAWIFEKDGYYVGFSLDKMTIIYSIYPRDDLNQICQRIEASGFKISTTEGSTTILQDKTTKEMESLSSQDALLIKVGKSLLNVFNGNNWDPELKFAYPTHLPDFAIRTYKETRKIPKGQVATYGEIAERIGSPGGARAVGNAMGKCPLSLIVPCHRVIKSNGVIGFTLAREILEREGIKFSRGKVIRKTQFD